MSSCRRAHFRWVCIRRIRRGGSRSLQCWSRATYMGFIYRRGEARRSGMPPPTLIQSTVLTPQLGNVVELLYGPAIFPAKLCVLMQMLRIFRGTKKDSVYWTILLLIWSNFILYVTVTFCFIFACGPRDQFSDSMLLGTCVRTTESYILATSAINIASDFSILLLPVYAVWKLKIELKRKITISAVFGTGVL